LTKPKHHSRSGQPSASDPAHREHEQFPIVGVGASAGGLEAFRRLLGALPSSTGMAYVLVQHLDPHHDSILAELLSEVTQMKVAEVKGDVRVDRDHVYVIPPSKDMHLVDGMLKLVPRAPPGAAHMPIDAFLKTLADVQGRQAIGVILSGMGSDGTLGLRAIEAAGGITIAQEPTSAQNADMPRSAIAARCVDFVLSPEDIASELKRLGRHPYLAAARASGSAADDYADAKATAHIEEQESFSRVLESLQKSSGTDFRAYKQTTLRRRIARRMAVSHVETLEEYARHLEGNAAEAGALFDDCLISVTSFFRDPEVFEVLSEQVLDALLKDRPADAPLRVWVPGCATGEEAYSIAMCLLERMAKLSRNPALQIFATDLSEAALNKAREGTYLVNIARDVSPERLRRFFTKVGDNYQISKTIREMCVFAQHDLTRDPPYSRLDLISCRNVLIYLEPRLQELVFATFHYALHPGGFLLVGPAETVGGASPLFTALDEKHRVYTRMAVSGPPRLLSVRDNPSPARASAEQFSRRQAASEVPREADRILLARFAPAAVVIDEGLRVLEFRGDTAPFLDHGHGKATLSLERLVRKGLLMELRQAIADARRTDAPIRKPGLQVRHRDSLQSVTLEVIPIKGRAAAERCLLVLFEAAGAAVGIEPPRPATAADQGDARDVEIERLGQGLAQTTEYVHTLVREHESALEELQATTEEALSSNEELQSLNEELQTAKEEIQSSNEELATLNQELQDRNAQLARSNEEIQRGLDSANELVDTVPGPLVILDDDLRVDRANLAFYELFKTTAGLARGRLLVELGSHHWRQPELLAALRNVLSSGAPLAEQPLDVEFPGVGERTLSLNARRLRPDRDPRWRLLLSVEDRTEVRAAERGRELLLALEHEARTRAESADQLKDEFVATASHELRGPLTVISGWMNILLEAGSQVDPLTLARALAAIGRGVTAQGRLISDLLDHSRIVAGKVELRRAPIDLAAVAEAALVGVRAAASAKDLDIKLTQQGLPCVVLGDFDRMQQVLWNLFLNAVKFTPPGGAVQISLGRGVGCVEVSVRDTGCGISDEFLPHVFDRFRQAEGSSARIQPGLGLGLTLVRELVELHGGTVRAESPGKDQGATFTVILPIPAVLLFPEASEVPPSSAPAKAETIPPAFEPPTPERHLLIGTRVLVVDDEADAREALVALLERYGAQVCSAASVAEAMIELSRSLPHVLVSDLGMPGADGYELMRQVRQLPADAGGNLPALAVSAYATDEHRKRVLKTGFQQHLEKPVAAAELVAAVGQLAGRVAISATD
jgi:two-component system, chemotaxis family, CheB/CheR fusion protein